MNDTRPVYVNVGTMTRGAVVEHLKDNHEWEYSYETHGTDPNPYEIHARYDHERNADHTHKG